MKVTHINMKRYAFNTVYEGFQTLEEAKAACIKKGLDINYMVFIFIFDTFHVVGFEDYAKQCIMNKEYLLYNNTGLWRKRLMRNNYKKLPSLINSFSHKKINPIIYTELLEVYPQTRCFTFEEESFVECDHEYYYHYYVLLGLFFKEKFYTRGNINEIKKYFKHIDAYYVFFLTYPFIESINPFKQQVKFFEHDKVFDYKYVYENYKTYFELPKYIFKGKKK